MISHMMTLANGIIGVSVLAMPYCFKQCGIILATLLLLLSSILSRIACHLLIKSAVMSRRRNFEFLAFHAFGKAGKFFVELFIIGFLMGTCVAFFVVMGDLGPEILGQMMGKEPEGIRSSLLVCSAIFVILPLGLLRNVDSLSSICTATIAFYICLVLKIMSESTRQIFAEDWYKHIYYWRPAGILQCLPIFSMALFCQTQLFEIYETLPNASLDKMNAVVKGALNICTSVYLLVGFFGYIAFSTQTFTGNILMSLEPGLTSEIIKLGFVISVAFSFPLVIFPCRASLNSLLFRRGYMSMHEPLANYIPEMRFRCLTFAIVAISLFIGIMIPNIEFVLGIVGSTIGVMICLIFPAAFFISINSKNTNERLIAQFMLLIGIWILTLGTYANLYAMEKSSDINNSLENAGKKFPEPINIKNNINIIDKIDEKFNSPENLPIKQPKGPQEPKPGSVNLENPKESVVVSPKPPPIIEKEPEKIKLEEKPEPEVNIPETKLKPETKPETIDSNNNLINSDAIKKEDSELAAEVDIPQHHQLEKTLEEHAMKQKKLMQEEREILKNISKVQKELEENKKIEVKKIADSMKPVAEIPETPKNQGNERIPKTPGKQEIENKVESKKTAASSSVGPEKISGILDVLTNKRIDINNTWNESDINKSAQVVEKVEKADLPVPIVLKINSQTKQANNAEDAKIAPGQREILEARKRMKREQANENVTKKPEEVICAKTDQASEEDTNLIKTDFYLSQPEIPQKTIPEVANIVDEKLAKPLSRVAEMK